MYKLFSLVFISFVFFAGKNKLEQPMLSYVKFSDNENLFIDNVEISNIDWLEYVSYNKHKFGEKSEIYLKSLPDSTVWKESKAYQSHYFTHAAYNYYPVVGVSYEQALDFCKWRSERVNIYFYLKKNKIIYHPDSNYSNAPKIYEFRLPKAEELKTIAEVNYSEKTKSEIEKKHKNKPKYNLKKQVNPKENIANSNVDITAPVKSYWPNALGIYNITGNVAEMTTKKGLACGGSWNDSYEDVLKSFDIKYDKPTNWLGFRCICEKKQ